MPVSTLCRKRGGDDDDGGGGGGGSIAVLAEDYMKRKETAVVVVAIPDAKVEASQSGTHKLSTLPNTNLKPKSKLHMNEAVKSKTNSFGPLYAC